jgi:hypothetical protein
MATSPSTFTATPAAIGAAATGAVAWQPSDNGLLGGTGDTTVFVNTSLVVAGTLYLVKLPVRTPQLITNIVLPLSAAGAGASTGSFTGLYSPAGTLLSGSADIGASFIAGNGQVPAALSTPQQVTGGTGPSSWPWAAILFNLATTQPTLSRGNGTISIPNGGLTAANFRFCVNGTGLAALPGSITPASNTTAGAFPFWAGWS